MNIFEMEKQLIIIRRIVDLDDKISWEIQDCDVGFVEYRKMLKKFKKEMIASIEKLIIKQANIRVLREAEKEVTS